MELVQLKNSFNSHVVKNSVQSTIVDKLRNIENIDKMKGNIEVILYVCNVVEQSIKKKDKVSKKELVLNVLTIVFSLSNEEILQTGNVIEFLFENNKIKIVSVFKKVGNCFYNFVKSKS